MNRNGSSAHRVELTVFHGGLCLTNSVSLFVFVMWTLGLCVSDVNICLCVCYVNSVFVCDFFVFVMRILCLCLCLCEFCDCVCVANPVFVCD